jgi:hypothetical protein
MFYVVDADTEETLGEIDTTDETLILKTLEDSDYIDDAEDCVLVPRPDGEYHVVENDITTLWLSRTDPEELDDDDDDDDDEDEDEDDDFEDEDEDD